MSLLDGKQLRDNSISINKLSEEPSQGNIILGTGSMLGITDTPLLPTDIPNKSYVDSLSISSPITQEIIPTSLLFDEDKVYKFIANSNLNISLDASGHADGVKYIIAIVDGDGVNGNPFVLPSYISLNGDAYDFDQRNTIVLIAESGRIISATNQVSVAPDSVAPVINNTVFNADNSSLMITTNEDSTTSTIVGTPIFAQNGDDITGVTLGAGVISGTIITYPVTISPSATFSNGLAAINATITLTDTEGNSANVSTGVVSLTNEINEEYIYDFDGNDLSILSVVDVNNIFSESNGNLVIGSLESLGATEVLYTDQLISTPSITLADGETVESITSGITFNQVGSGSPDNRFSGIGNVSNGFGTIYWGNQMFPNVINSSGTSVEATFPSDNSSNATYRTRYTYNASNPSNSIIQVSRLTNGSYVQQLSFNYDLGNQVNGVISIFHKPNRSGAESRVSRLEFRKL